MLANVKKRIKRLWSPAKRTTWPVEMIEYPTDFQLIGDGTTEAITLKGNLFWCAWGMKGIRQANPDFVEQWLAIDDVNESAVILCRPSTRVVYVFIPRGTAAPAQLIPDTDIPPSQGHMDLVLNEPKEKQNT